MVELGRETNKLWFESSEGEIEKLGITW